MQAYEKNGLKIFEFRLLKEFKSISHGTLSRHGGFSKSPYNSLNLNLESEGLSKELELNFKKVAETLHIPNPVWASQAHQDHVEIVNSKNLSQSFVCDGFITGEAGITLLIKHADCQAALFFDPVQKVIANVHSGWKGSVLNIYKKTIQKMKDIFGCSPENIIVCISPSLSPKHAEFIHYQKELPKSFWKYRDAQKHFNFWKISEDQLIEAGILKNHIEIAELCTYENHNDFFSYRKENVTGRNITFISMGK